MQLQLLLLLIEIIIVKTSLLFRVLLDLSMIDYYEILFFGQIDLVYMMCLQYVSETKKMKRACEARSAISVYVSPSKIEIKNHKKESKK
jgi:hypothetical protein